MAAGCHSYIRIELDLVFHEKSLLEIVPSFATHSEVYENRILGIEWGIGGKIKKE